MLYVGPFFFRGGGLCFLEDKLTPRVVVNIVNTLKELLFINDV